MITYLSELGLGRSIFVVQILSRTMNGCKESDDLLVNDRSSFSILRWRRGRSLLRAEGFSLRIGWVLGVDAQCLSRSATRRSTWAPETPIKVFHLHQSFHSLDLDWSPVRAIDQTTARRLPVSIAEREKERAAEALTRVFSLFTRSKSPRVVSWSFWMF